MVAIARACFLVANTPSPTRLTKTGAVEAVAVVAAVAGASVQGAVVPIPPRVTLASRVRLAFAMTRALVGTHLA